jgi:hypothetical protein
VRSRSFVEGVEIRYKLPTDFRKFIDLVKNGARADKSFKKGKCGIMAGDWIVRSYSPRLLNTLRKAAKKGRLVERERVK